MTLSGGSSVLQIHVEQCERSGGYVKAVARIEDPAHLVSIESLSRVNDAKGQPDQPALF